MQVDVSEILTCLDAELVIYTEEEFIGNNDEVMKQKEAEYIEETLKKNNILYDGGGDYYYTIRDSQIPRAVEAFGLEVGDLPEMGDEGHALVNMEGNDLITATLYFDFSDNNIGDLASWLVEK